MLAIGVNLINESIGVVIRRDELTRACGVDAAAAQRSRHHGASRTSILSFSTTLKIRLKIRHSRVSLLTSDRRVTWRQGHGIPQPSEILGHNMFGSLEESARASYCIQYSSRRGAIPFSPSPRIRRRLGGAALGRPGTFSISASHALPMRLWRWQAKTCS